MLHAMRRLLRPLSVLTLILGDVCKVLLLLQHGVVFECMVVPRLHGEVTPPTRAHSTIHVEAVRARDY